MSDIIIHPFSWEVAVELIFMFFFLFCSALISASEIGFFSLNKMVVDELKQGTDSERRVYTILQQPKRLLATILIANNFVNICVVVLSTFVMETLFDFSNVQWLGFLLQVVVVTFLILLIGEIIPKVYSSGNPRKVAVRMAFWFKS